MRISHSLFSRFGQPGFTRPLLAATLLASACQAAAQDSLLQPAKLKEQMPTNSVAKSALMDELRWLKAERITITSVSKRAEDPFEAAAAVSVVTGDDLRRSGVRTLPDALRMVPGLQVAQVNRHNWAISARGFNQSNADKLLVLVDGRTVYSPLFNGVFWDRQDYLLEDIERIEVVRGPGGTLWGANAVNGVINIITQEARNTGGTYVMAGGGSTERGFGGVRYGAPIRDDLWFRGYLQYKEGVPYPGGHDGMDMTQGGGRLEWQLSEARVTLQGDYYISNHDERVVVPNFAGPVFFPQVDGPRRAVGANVLARYERTFSDESDLHLQVYYDSVHDRDPARNQLNKTEIVDVEFQHRFALPGGQTVIYGLGYRYLPTLMQNSASFTFAPSRREQQVANAFIQDQISLLDDKVRITLGTKVEHNDITGLEWQPNARIAWLPTAQHTLWGAVSRAVQVPGRANTDIAGTALTGGGPIPGAFISPFLAGANPFFVRFAGSPALKAQELISYELGHRWQATDRLSLDLTGFHGRYDSLFSSGPTTVEPSFVPGTPSFLTATFVNGGTADLTGLEVASLWRATEHWRLQGSYSWLHQERRPRPTDEGSDAPHMATLRSTWDLPWNLELDVMGRFVDRLSFFDSITTTTTTVGAYVGLDARLGWRPTKNIELAVVGQNLISASRVQFTSLSVYTQQVTPVPRGVYGTLAWRF